MFIQGAFFKPDLFDDVVPLCTKTSDVINSVFSSPDAVMSRFVQNIYHGRIQVRNILLWGHYSSSPDIVPHTPLITLQVCYERERERVIRFYAQSKVSHLYQNGQHSDGEVLVENH